MKEVLTSRLFWAGFLLALAIFFFAMYFKLIFMRSEMQAQMDKFQKIVKSSADKNETSKQFYDNYFVKEVPDSFYSKA